jgi:hypothetical protein
MDINFLLRFIMDNSKEKNRTYINIYIFNERYCT